MSTSFFFFRFAELADMPPPKMRALPFLSPKGHSAKGTSFLRLLRFLLDHVNTCSPDIVPHIKPSSSHLVIIPLELFR